MGICQYLLRGARGDGVKNLAAIRVLDDGDSWRVSPEYTLGSIPTFLIWLYFFRLLLRGFLLDKNSNKGLPMLHGSGCTPFTVRTVKHGKAGKERTIIEILKNFSRIYSFKISSIIPLYKN